MKVTINLTDSTFLRTVGGQAINLDWTAIAKHPTVLSEILIGGAKIMLTNAFNSGGKDIKESERLANMQKRMDAWARGEFAIVGGARDSLVGDMRDAFYIEKGAQDAASRKALDKQIQAMVAKRFGEKETATFTRFLDAVAAELAEARKANAEELRAKLQEKYEAAAHALRAERAKAGASIDVSDLI